MTGANTNHCTTTELYTDAHRVHSNAAGLLTQQSTAMRGLRCRPGLVQEIAGLRCFSSWGWQARWFMTQLGSCTCCLRKLHGACVHGASASCLSSTFGAQSRWRQSRTGKVSAQADLVGAHCDCGGPCVFFASKASSCCNLPVVCPGWPMRVCVQACANDTGWTGISCPNPLGVKPPPLLWRPVCGVLCQV